MPRPTADPQPPIADNVLYVTSQGTQIGTRQNQYVVRDVADADSDSNSEKNDSGTDSDREADESGEQHGSERLAAFPVEKVETINIFGRGVDVTTATIATAAKHETAINFFYNEWSIQGAVHTRGHLCCGATPPAARPW